MGEYDDLFQHYSNGTGQESADTARAIGEAEARMGHATPISQQPNESHDHFIGRVNTFNESKK